MSQNRFMFISPNSETARKLLAILAFSVSGLVLACEDVPGDLDSLLTDSPAGEEETEARFGFFPKKSIKNWSALWHMSQKGSIEFCIINKAWHADEDEEEMITKLRHNLEYAVDAWIRLLRKDPPDGSFPAWRRPSIDVRFGCSGDHYNVTLGSGGGSRASIWTAGASILIHYKQNNETVVAHEFGHIMGLQDTYPEDWYRDQPDSMMKNRKWSDDDKFAIWALWKYIKTGEISCGPGYYEEEPGKCIPKSDDEDDSGDDASDACPDDPQKTEPGVCGCGTRDSDGDGDGTPDCRDECPSDPNKINKGNCGCGKPEGSCGSCVDQLTYCPRFVDFCDRESFQEACCATCKGR